MEPLIAEVIRPAFAYPALSKERVVNSY